MIRLRELGQADAQFLGEMLYEALFWTPRKERLPIEFVLAHPPSRGSPATSSPISTS